MVQNQTESRIKDKLFVIDLIVCDFELNCIEWFWFNHFV